MLDLDCSYGLRTELRMNGPKLLTQSVGGLHVEMHISKCPRYG